MNTSDDSDRMLLAMNNRWRMWLFYLFKLPSAWFWGIRIKSADLDTGVVTLPYSWSSKNPFCSIYFAAQAGAAELSTGLLGLITVENKPPISMLITGVEATFVKKADSLTTFTCDEGSKIRETVERAIETGEGHEITVISNGIDSSGEVVSLFKFTWSFKLKTSK
jgi:uncharacterized protein DUF4442